MVNLIPKNYLLSKNFRIFHTFLTIFCSNFSSRLCKNLQFGKNYSMFFSSTIIFKIFELIYTALLGSSNHRSEVDIMFPTYWVIDF